MTRKLLDNDDTQESRTATRSGGGSRIALWLLVILLLLTVAILITLITRQPGTLGLIAVADLRQTDSAVQSTMSALQATDQHNQQRDLDLLNTQAALNNFASRLSQTETQQAVNNSSTVTAVALANAAQATQAAVDFASTQAALQQISTQIQHDFEATQTALGSSFATIEANRPPQNLLILNGDFIRGVETGSQSSSSLAASPAWALSDTGALIAQTANATVLTRPTAFNVGYTVNVRMIVPPVAANYEVLFSVVENVGGYTLRLYYDGTRIEKAALFAFDVHDLTDPDGLSLDESTALNITSGLALTGSDLTVEVQVDGAQVNALVNGTPLLTAALPAAPLNGTAGVQAGIQLKTGAQLQLLQLITR